MKKVFLTGASGDIGKAIKNVFEKNEYIVTAPKRNQLNLENILSVKEYFSTADLEFDILIHCAGFNNPKVLEELTFEDIDKTAMINYISFFEIVKSISPYMISKKKGYILAISSLYSNISRSGRLAYTASKHALNGVIKTLACELGGNNILVNSLSPGFVVTKMTSKNNSKDAIDLLVKRIPLQRLALPQDIADVAFYLCSKNTYITGQNIIVDGGFMISGEVN
ncbi:MAG: SDR family oxidoreductase [Endomicrobium sp.]|jgi:3-oxoacyl-[acyl-carrier protein] reductase|nr:SDR family oxidoreductase [Endomicrobium sp.]